MSSGKEHPFCGFASALRGEEGGGTLSAMSSLGSNQILRCLPTGSLYLPTQWRGSKNLGLQAGVSLPRKRERSLVNSWRAPCVSQGQPVTLSLGAQSH